MDKIKNDQNLTFNEKNCYIIVLSDHKIISKLHKAAKTIEKIVAQNSLFFDDEKDELFN